MCFGFPWLESLLVSLVVLVLVVAILRAVAAFVVPRMGLAGDAVALVGQIIWWLIVAAVIIFAIRLMFDVIYCLPRLR